MSAKYQIRKIGDTFHISGHMNEHTDLAPLLAATDDPIKVDMEGVTGINTVGTKALMTMIRDLGTRIVEFHGLPSFFVELVNVVPSLIGKRAKNVVSMFVPYHCRDCNQTTDVLIKRDEVKIDNTGVRAPGRRCSRCGMNMRPHGEEDDIFLFMTYSA